jgi:hypothetical protein
VPANDVTTAISKAEIAPRWQKLLAWTGPVLLALGFVIAQMWRSFPAPRALETLLLASFALALGWLAQRLFAVRMASAIAAIFILALSVFAGPIAVVSGTLLAASSGCIGASIGRGRADAPAMVVGLSVLTGLLGWLLPFPIHYRAIYFALLVAPLALRRAKLVEDARHLIRSWHTAIDESPRLAAFAIVVVGLCSAGCWFPTIQFDDLAYHLDLPAQLSALHYYRLDAHSQIWALAPWAGDVAQGIAQVVAGRETRGAVDAIWLLGVVALIWRASRLLDADTSTRWLAVAVAASQPLLASLCGGMQAELPATAATLGLVVLVLERDEESPRADTMRFACVAALMLGLKTGFIAIVLPLAVAFAWRHRGRSLSLRTIAATSVFLLLSGSSYFYACVLTGDPFYPLFANAFSSGYPIPDMTDMRWRADIGASAVWSLTFHTAAYHEGWDGAAGFSLLGLCGASMLALYAKRTRTIALCSMLAFAAAIVTIHYFRYTCPAAVVLIAPSLVALARALPMRQVTGLACALVVGNLGYQSCASWILHVGGIKHRLMHTDLHVFDRFAPTRDLLRDVDAESNVLFCSPNEPANAELAGRGFTVAHYDIALERDRVAADADASGATWRKLFQRTHAGYAMVSLLGAENPALQAALADAHLVREAGSRQLWRLPPQSAPPKDLAHVRDAARARFRP